MKNEFDDMPTQNYEKFKEIASELDVVALVDFTSAIARVLLNENIPEEIREIVEFHFSEVDSFKKDLVVSQSKKEDIPIISISWLLEDIQKILPYANDALLQKDLIESDELFQNYISRFLTDKKCPKCQKTLFLSDLPQYDYVCGKCDENFDTFELKEE